MQKLSGKRNEFGRRSGEQLELYRRSNLSGKRTEYTPAPWQGCTLFSEVMAMETFLFLLELAGTVAFAVSGAVLGIEKHMDIFGVGLLGSTTAVGGGSLRGGRGDGINQVDVVAHELVGDGLTRGLVVLGVLLVDLDLKTALLDGLDKAVVGGIECGVLGELQNADGVVGTGGSRAGTRVAAASGERSEREQASRDQKAPAADGDVLHIDTPQYRNGWNHCTQTKCKWNYSSADVHFYNNLAGFLIQNRMGDG